MIECYADGCRKITERGAWAYLIYLNGQSLFASQFMHHVTNNITELQGPTEILCRLLEEAPKEEIVIYSDSQYFVKGFNEWMHKWQRNQWNRGTLTNFAEVANLDMWKLLFEYKKRIKSRAVWVRGHNNHKENEFCDMLANYTCKNQVNIIGEVKRSLTTSVLGAHELQSFIQTPAIKAT